MTAPRRITSKYPGTCRICRTPFRAGAAIRWQAGTPGATCADASACATAKAAAEARAAAPPPPPALVDAAPIVAFLTAARERGLKFPKARFVAPDGRAELRLSVAGSQSRTPGAVQVVIGDHWQGRIGTDGTTAGPGMTAALCQHLEAIAAAPAIAAKQYAAVTSRCSFCALPLTDAGSVEVGYGPICADRSGLPHTAKGTPTAQTTAELHEDDGGADWTDDDRDAADEATAARRETAVTAGRIARHWDDDLPF
jgi:Family of unknown function (DUF6011)